MRRTRNLFIALAVFASMVAPTEARADKRDPLAGQPEIRHKVELRKLRFEVTPQLVVSMNQDFRHFIGGGLVLQLHITDWLGVAAQFAGGGGVDSGLTKNLLEQLPDNEGEGAPFQPSKQQFRDHLASISAMFSIYATLTPFAGKMSIFGAAFLHYDLYALVGVGGLYLTNSFTGSADHLRDCLDTNVATDPNTCDPQNNGIKFGGAFGVGAHVYFNDWLAFNIELRDFLARTNMSGLEGTENDANRKINSDDEALGNHLFVGIGLTFMLPPRAKISP